jgi:hypothetical protein
VHGDSGSLADEFIVGAFVGILKASPTADVIDEDAIIICEPGFDVGDHRFEPVAPANSEAAEAFVRVGADNLQSPVGGVYGNDVSLVLR